MGRLALGLRIGMGPHGNGAGGGGTPTPTPADPTAFSSPYSGPLHFNASGATSPTYAHAVDPPAAYYSDLGKTLFFFERLASGNNRQQYAITYDHPSSTWATPVTTNMASGLNDDDHGVVAHCRDYQGYFWAFGHAHGTSPIRVSRSTAASVATAWTSQTAVGTNLAYPSPVATDAGIWLFARKQGGSTMPLVRHATTALAAGAATWGTEETLIDFGADSRVYQFGVQRVGRKIYKLLHYANNADTLRRDFYIAVFDEDNPTQVSNIEGTRTDSFPVAKATMDTYYRVADQTAAGAYGGSGHFWIDGSNNIWLAYLNVVAGSDVITDPRDVVVKRFDWTSKTWGSPEVVSGTRPAAGRVTAVAVGASTGGLIEVYYAAYSTANPTRWERAGDMIRAQRSSGGVWSTSVMLATTTQSRLPYDRATRVKDAHANFQWIWAEAAMDPSIGGTSGATTNNRNGGDCCIYAYGDSGFLKKRATVHASTTAMIARDAYFDTDAGKAALDMIFDARDDNGVSANMAAMWVLPASQYAIGGSHATACTGSSATWVRGEGWTVSGGGYVSTGYVAASPMTTTAKAMQILMTGGSASDTPEAGFTGSNPFELTMRRATGGKARFTQGAASLDSTVSPADSIGTLRGRQSGTTSMEIWPDGASSGNGAAGTAVLPTAELRFYTGSPAGVGLVGAACGNGYNDITEHVQSNMMRRLCRFVGVSA